MGKSAVGTNKGGSKKVRTTWRLHLPVLFLPLACLLSIILGTAFCLLLTALTPFDRSASLGLAVIVAPLVGGAFLNYLIGAKRQWRTLGLLFLLALIVAGMTWSLNTLIWID
ncbi:MAG: hypothetical protein AAF065_10640 [Verrucomicrobiota bacterium]